MRSRRLTAGRWWTFPLVCTALLCCLAAAQAEDEFEIVGQASSSRKRTSQRKTARGTTSRRAASSRRAGASASPQEIAPNADHGGSDEFVITTGKKEAKKPSSAGGIIITDDPNFEIVQRGPGGGSYKPRDKAMREFAAAKKKYDGEKAEYDRWLADAKRERNFLFFSYLPYDNTINGADARLFLTLGFVSAAAAGAMLAILVRELGRRPPVYSTEQMADLRAQGLASVSAQEAQCFVMTLWHNLTGGKVFKENEYVPFTSRSEIAVAAQETAIAAATLPVDGESVDRLNDLADAVCFWQGRRLVAPGISIDSGIVKRVIMAVIYCILLYLYRGHPMYLLVILSPLAFLTPRYLVWSRENSVVYRMLGGSLKIFGKMLGNAAEGAGRMEGATATVYKTSSGKTYIEENYWGVLILFALKIALACFFLWLVYLAAPLIVLYAIVRNYILAK